MKRKGKIIYWKNKLYWKNFHVLVISNKCVKGLINLGVKCLGRMIGTYKGGWHGYSTEPIVLTLQCVICNEGGMPSHLPSHLSSA